MRGVLTQKRLLDQKDQFLQQFAERLPFHMAKSINQRTGESSVSRLREFGAGPFDGSAQRMK